MWHFCGILSSPKYLYSLLSQLQRNVAAAVLQEHQQGHHGTLHVVQRVSIIERFHCIHGCDSAQKLILCDSWQQDHNIICTDSK